MPELTDDDILELADRLILQLDLDQDGRDAIVLAVQRLVWSPSHWPFLHENEHIRLEIGKHDGGGWHGELLCPHGCARRWRVNKGPSEAAVHGALEAAHEEYRTGKPRAVSPPTRGGEHRVSLVDLFNPVEYVEVTDERLTAEKVSD